MDILNLILLETGFEAAVQGIGFVVGSLTILTVMGGFIWYIFKGKNIEELKESNARWKDIAEANKAKVQNLQTEISDLSRKVAELTAEVGRLERKVERMEQREEEKDEEILRLKGAKGKD